jgi:thiamine-phosphate pyrophosphorylase
VIAVAPLYLITDRSACRGRPLFDVVEAAVTAGVRWVQYREKGLSRRARYEEARRLRDLTRTVGALLIVNDELDLAVAVEADGLHLGQEDLPLPLARRHLGRGRLIGISTHTLEEAMQAARDGADYLAVGPVFPTATKSVREPVGCAAIQRVRAAVSLPLVAIGGITPDNAGAVVRAGADSLAVVSAVCGAADIRSVVEAFDRVIETARPSSSKNA